MFWLWTPYILLGKRVPWHRLIPTGFVTTVCITVYSIGTAIFLPDIFTTNAERYGLIGIAFGMVTWLFAYAAVVIVSAVLGWTWDQHREATAGEHHDDEQQVAAGQPGTENETVDDAEQQGA